MRALFNRFPTRELFYADLVSLKQTIDRIVYMTGDDEIALNVREGRGYVSLAIAFSRLRYSYHVEHALAGALSDTFGPVTFQTSADCGSVSLLLSTSTGQLEHDVDRPTRAQITTALSHLGGPRAAAMELASARAPQLSSATPRESRSGLYREARRRRGPAGVLKHLRAWRPLEVPRWPRSAERC
jgi:hypothetical protein